MQIKTQRMVEGIPTAQIAASPGVQDSGAPQVTSFINAVDCYDQRSVVASLWMSPAEARDYAARLIDAADKADRMAVEGDLCGRGASLVSAPMTTRRRLACAIWAAAFQLRSAPARVKVALRDAHRRAEYALRVAGGLVAGCGCRAEDAEFCGLCLGGEWCECACHEAPDKLRAEVERLQEDDIPW